MPKGNLPILPDQNRTKHGLELFDNFVQESFKGYVFDQLEKTGGVAGKLPKKLPANLIERAIVIDGKEFNALIENRNLLDGNQVQELVNRTIPLIHPSVTNTVYEGLYRYKSIFSDWKILPVSTHLGLSGLNAVSCYNHGLMCIRSLVVGNFVDASFHTSVAAWNAYRAVFQLMTITSPVDSQDVLLEGVSFFLTSNLLKVKNWFIKGRNLNDGIEVAMVLIMLPFSKMENVLEEPSLLGEQPEATTEASFDNFIDDSELETLLHVLMIDFD